MIGGQDPPPLTSTEQQIQLIKSNLKNTKHKRLRNEIEILKQILSELEGELVKTKTLLEGETDKNTKQYTELTRLIESLEVKIKEIQENIRQKEELIKQPSEVLYQGGSRKTRKTKKASKLTKKTKASKKTRKASKVSKKSKKVKAPRRRKSRKGKH